MQRRINVNQSKAFAHPLMMVGDVTVGRDFDKSTRDHPVQAVDKETGLRVWEAEVIDTDPEARKSERSFTVKLIAAHQPVPPAAADGSTMRPVVFTHLEAMPWVDSRTCTGNEQPHRCRARVAWSYRATGFADGGDTTQTASGSSSGSSKSSSSSRAA